MGRARRVVGRQIVKRRRNASLVQEIPKGHALPPKDGLGRLMIERPEIQLQPVVSYVPMALAGKHLRGRIEWAALVVRMAVHKVKDAVRARPGAVNEVGPGDGALRRNAGA